MRILLIPVTLALNNLSIQDRLAEVSNQVAKLKNRSVKPASSVAVAEVSVPTHELSDAEETRALLRDVEAKLTSFESNAASNQGGGGGSMGMISEISALQGSVDAHKVEINVLKASLGTLRSGTEKQVADLRTEIGNVREGLAEQVSLRLTAVEADIKSTKTASTAEETKPKYSAEELYAKIVNLEKSIDTLAVQSSSQVAASEAAKQDAFTKLTTTPEGQFTLAVGVLALLAVLLALRGHKDVGKVAVDAPGEAAKVEETVEAVQPAHEPVQVEEEEVV